MHKTFIGRTKIWMKFFTTKVKSESSALGVGWKDLYSNQSCKNDDHTFLNPHTWEKLRPLSSLFLVEGQVAKSLFFSPNSSEKDYSIVSIYLSIYCLHNILQVCYHNNILKCRISKNCNSINFYLKYVLPNASITKI
jgi:hypothetical protein